MSLHGQASSSLPSDYALLSRYRASRSAVDDTRLDDQEEPQQLPSQYGSINSKKRRMSFPQPPSYKPVANIPRMSHRFQKSPETDLLLPPRIDEDCQSPPPSIHELGIWKEEAWLLVQYTFPVFISHLLEYSLTIVSVVSVGHISTTALASITIGTMTAAVTGLCIAQGFASALDTLLPSAFTSDDPTLVGLWSQRMGVVMGLTLVPIIALWLNATPLLIAIKQEPEVAHLAGIYLKWFSIGLPGYMFNTISRRYFQSQGLFAIPTRIITFVAPINVILNYLLVWGPEPIRLGFIGAPLATAISFNLISICSVIYGVFFVPKTAWRPFSTRSFTNLGVVVTLGLAGIGQTASEWWSWELVGLAASLLGPVPLAAQSVLLVTGSTSYQAPYALSVASSVRIGNLLGQQNAKRARITSHVSMIVALSIAGVFSSVFLIFRKSWGYLFNDDLAVVGLVAEIMPLVALFQCFDCLSAVTGGILRARGQQSVGALLNLVAYYVIGIPLGLWFAFRIGMNLIGLWIGLTIALVFVSTIGVLLAIKTDWNKEVRKVRERLEADNQILEADTEGLLGTS